MNEVSESSLVRPPAAEDSERFMKFWYGASNCKPADAEPHTIDTYLSILERA